LFVRLLSADRRPGAEQSISSIESGSTTNHNYGSQKKLSFASRRVSPKGRLPKRSKPWFCEAKLREAQKNRVLLLKQTFKAKLSLADLTTYRPLTKPAITTDNS
jgi:hypothetical protein